VLQKHHPLYINTHFNHPAELTPRAVKGLGMLADAGVPLGCQTVLLKGVNDDVEVMKELMQRLLVARVRPYYIFMCDNVAGVEHFKAALEKGLEIISGLRGWTSGLAVPHFVIDAPGGGGKIPLLPEYVESITETEVVLRNYRGDRYRYPQPRSEVLVAAGIAESAYAVESTFDDRPVGNGNGRRKSRNGNRTAVKRKRS
jgi:lysine 2,3-aminomutase